MNSLLRLEAAGRLTWVSPLLSAFAVLLFLIPGAGELMEFQRRSLENGQVWRLFTGHLTHASPSQLVLSLAVFLGLGFCLERRDRPRFLITVVGSMLTISTAVWLFDPGLLVYRGLSGVDSALFGLLLGLLLRIALCQRRPAIALLTAAAGVGFLAKTGLELATGSAVFASDAAGYVPLALAHMTGALTGFLVALLPDSIFRREDKTMFVRLISRRKVTRFSSAAAVLLLTAVPALGAAGNAVHRSVPLGELQLTEGELPDRIGQASWRWGSSNARGLMAPRVSLDTPGLAEVLDHSPEQTAGSGLDLSICLKTPGDTPVTGQLFLPRSGFESMTMVRFHVPAGAGKASAATEFRSAQQQRYQRLAAAGLPGAAWFRYQAHRLSHQDDREAGAFWDQDVDDANLNALSELGYVPGQPPRGGNRDSELQQTFGLFTGARAMSENLQLDRVLLVRDSSKETVNIDSLAGITVAALDWTARMEGKEPALDPLAQFIPSDQHALFFPSFKELLAVIDESQKSGTPILRLMEEQAVDATTRQRYERQLCLPLNQLTRTFGPLLVKSVAITGSDPYLRTGSDVAVLFEAQNAEALESMLMATQDAALLAESGGEDEAEPVSGVYGKLSYRGVKSADRSICSYLARHDDLILITNSMVQIRRLSDVLSGKRAGLASLDEYRFFRDRYQLDEDESVFLMLTDETIRRWCGPRWRIGASRRIRAAAVMSHIEARKIDHRAGQAGAVGKAPDLTATYGDLGFITPIAELELDRVTQPEASAYERYRNLYQRNWRAYFDPIGLRIHVTPDGFESDLTVLPLIASTDFREFIQIVQDAEIETGDGDPHEEAIFHYVQAINLQAPPIRDANNFFQGMLMGSKVSPLGWVDDTVSLYIDDDPVWSELDDLDKVDDFLEDNISRLPVAITIGVKDPLGLAAFLTAVRGFAMQSAPGMVVWETVEYGERMYVKISEEKGMRRGGGPEWSICYAVVPGSLILTPNEALLRRAMDRAFAPDRQPSKQTWPGRSMAVRLDQRALLALEGLLGDWQEENLKFASWRNLVILDEWKRLFPDEDPLAVHARHFHQELVCPGGGRYVFNAEWGGMESTAYGRPEAPRDEATAVSLLESFLSAALGITFEDDGLRARVSVQR